jgi:hypothetical protein
VERIPPFLVHEIDMKSSTEIKILLKKNASAALTRELLNIPEGGKTIKVGSGDKAVAIRFTANHCSTSKDRGAR